LTATPGLGPVGGGALPPPGLGAGGLGAMPGFAPTGGGFGLLAIGGGGFEPTVLGARELAGVVSDELLPTAGFFQGVFDPFTGAIPGNTDTGFADACAATGLRGVAAGTDLGAAGAATGAGAGTGRRPGGGGGAAGAFGFGGTGSR